jgi:hypothetical protein
VLLTSRFPFADLEGFDGGTARMLEVPAFIPPEGAALLAAGGGDWLPEDQRQDLVRAVDGHALATGVLAGLLADHLPAGDLAALRAELGEATLTDARVSKVLEFYADRLAEADRYLLAAVSLFARPVDAGAVLAVARHEAFGSRLAGWTPAMVQAAVRIQVRNYDSAHLYSLPGIWWADFLALTGRQDPARVLTLRNIAISRKNRWNEDVARSDRAMGRLALAAGDTAAAGGHLVAAAAVFRDGDYLTEIAPALADLAEHARVSGDLDVAERHATEAIAIAAPRGLVPAHCAALAARARIRATRATTGYPDLLYSGRDAADAAARLAARHQLPWCELDALRAHALLDQAEGIDRGWAARVDALYARLVPYGLDPDPLATVERSVGKKGRRGRRGSED